MRIEIVVYERNMSESSSKRGPKRRFTDSERKQRKRESNAKFEQDMDWRPVWSLEWAQISSTSENQRWSGENTFGLVSAMFTF